MAAKGRKAPLPTTRPVSRAIKLHEQSFRDHGGNTSLMVFWAPIDQPLPPLYSFAIYVTAPDVTPDTLGASDLLKTLTTSRYAPETTTYRLDIYFRPGASIDECEAHYDAEKAARGVYGSQLEALVSADGADPEPSPSSPGQGKLPGLVLSYLRTPSFCHHDVLFICDRDWRTEGMHLVEFHPAGPGEFQPDPEDARDIVAPTKARVYTVCPDPAMYDGMGTVQESMFNMFLIREQELSGPYEEALGRGWQSW